jgi:tRNA(Ile)-lysidine synthase
VRRFRIPYVQDSSNQKDTYERNYLRNRVVPLIERLNPRFREKILLLMRDLSSVNTLFDDEAELFLVNEEHREQGDIRFSVEVLKQLHPETRFRVISRTLSRLASTVQPGSTERPHFVALREHVLLVEKSLLSARPNNRVDLPHGIKVRRVYGEIIFTRKQSTVAPACSFDIEPGENQIPSLGVNLTVSISNERPAHLSEGNETAFFDAEKISSMTVRTFREGDRFMPLGMKASVKLKDYFISKKIPRDNRRNIPLLTSNGQIIWIVGQRMDERYKVTDGTVRFLKIKAQFVL